MGFIKNLFAKLFGRKSAKKTTTQPASTAAAKPTAKKATPATKRAKKEVAKKAATPSKAARPQCAAVTPAGAQCKNSARAGSKYCGSHKGYRPKAADAGAKDTKPRAAKAKDTAPTGRKTPAKKAAPKQVSNGDYLLYQSGSRYFFSKKKAPQKGWKKVNKMPAGYHVKKTPNGLPVLAKK